MIDKQLKKEYHACEQLMKEHSKTFYSAFRSLDKNRANAVYAIYAFCRIVDDFADVDHSLEKIEQHEIEFKQMLQGDIPDHYMWRALADAFERFPLEEKGFMAQIAGQKYDMTSSEMATEVDLENYCYLVAGSVGEMMLPLLTKEVTPFAHDVALKLGEAMQITNILRDIGQDLSLNRRYLPSELMNQFGYTEQMLKNKVINNQLIELIDYMMDKANSLYDFVALHVDVYLPKVQPSILMALYYYREILNKIIENNYDVFYKRAFVSKREKLKLIGAVLREG